MNELEECMRHYNRLKAALEEDYDEIGNALRGDMLDAYRGLITQEKKQVDQATTILKHLI